MQDTSKTKYTKDLRLRKKGLSATEAYRLIRAHAIREGVPLPDMVAKILIEWAESLRVVT
jgi:AmiR/NasT family two-component response regulator